MSKERIGIIRPEVVAHKVAAIRNYEQPKLLQEVDANPRLLEMLWFLQYVSTQPGGLGQFCVDLVREIPHHIGTATLRAAGNSILTLDQKLAIYKEIPKRFMPDSCEQLEVESDLYSLAFPDSPDFRRTQHRHEDQRAVEGHFKKLDSAYFRKTCQSCAAKLLPGYLAALCTQIDKPFTHEDGYGQRELWFIDDVPAAVMEMMDWHAQRAMARLAPTVVANKVFDALDFAIQEKAMVRIEGDSRFGKTEAVKAWCNVRPGRARLVSVPCSNSLSDLQRRVAEALGMDVSYGSRTQGIKEKIEYVLQHSGLFIVLDEAAFLVPQNYTPTTAPARLNWLRTEIVDRGLPLAVVVTPQTFMPLVNRFVKKTGYAMEQFFGRTFRVVELPEKLEPEDMVLVARIHFPEMDEDRLALIADLAGMSENYLQAVEAIAKLARYIARREKHRKVTVDDLEAAADEVIPARRSAVMAEQRGSASPSHKEAGKRVANEVLTGGSRGVKAARTRAADASDFEGLPSCSLRGTGLGRAEPLLVAAET